MASQPEIGAFGWCDLTVPNADAVRDFYKDVVGWTVTDVSMGDYSDYAMNAPGSGRPVAGVCHAQGINADLPPAWLVYFHVDSLDASIAACQRRGGQVLAGPKSFGPDARYCVIRDPGGAVAALYEGTFQDPAEMTGQP